MTDEETNAILAKAEGCMGEECSIDEVDELLDLRDLVVFRVLRARHQLLDRVGGAENLFVDALERLDGVALDAATL